MPGLSGLSSLLPQPAATDAGVRRVGGRAAVSRLTFPTLTKLHRNSNGIRVPVSSCRARQRASMQNETGRRVSLATRRWTVKSVPRVGATRQRLSRRGLRRRDRPRRPRAKKARRRADGPLRLSARRGERRRARAVRRNAPAARLASIAAARHSYAAFGRFGVTFMDQNESHGWVAVYTFNFPGLPDHPEPDSR